MTKRSLRLAAKIDADTLRRIAVSASCDPRTIRAIVEGRAVRGLAGERARAALIQAGYLVGEK